LLLKVPGQIAAFWEIYRKNKIKKDRQDPLWKAFSFLPRGY
jgi:hypothetical protein